MNYDQSLERLKNIMGHLVWEKVSPEQIYHGNYVNLDCTKCCFFGHLDRFTKPDPEYVGHFHTPVIAELINNVLDIGTDYIACWNDRATPEEVAAMLNELGVKLGKLEPEQSHE